MLTRRYIIFFIAFMPAALMAQHKTEHTNMLWVGYYNTIHFNKNWSIVSDAQGRTRDWSRKWSQLLVRSGVTYKFNDRVAVTAGLAFFKNAQYVEKRLLFKNEWRPHQEISYQLKLHKTNIVQRLRTEQRFLQLVKNNSKTEQYEFIFRVRYRFDWQLPLQKNNLKLLLGNEIHVNPGHVNNSRFFDQNRTYAGINYKILSNTSLQFQYLKIFQYRSSAAVLEDQNVVRLNIVQQFNFK